MPDRHLSSLLHHDPDLGARLDDPERLEAARAELQVAAHTLDTGPWEAARLAGASPGHIGLLVLDGVLAREVLVADTVSTELLGQGDVIRPWRVDDEAALLRHDVRWNVLTRSRIALLDRRLAAQLGRYPEINAALFDRVDARAQRLALTQAISQVNRVDRRVIALLWHLAERWGRMTPDGVAIPLTLSHRMLGQLVGARRPTVSTAVGELLKSGELARRTDGTWLLTGEPVGVPTMDVERVIPMRRHLIPSERGRSTPVPPELRAELDTLRARTEAQISDLLAAYARSTAVDPAPGAREADGG
jgi:hypothetical protein